LQEGEKSRALPVDAYRATRVRAAMWLSPRTRLYERDWASPSPRCARTVAFRDAWLRKDAANVAVDGIEAKVFCRRAFRDRPEWVEARNVETLEIEDPATLAIIVRTRRRNSRAPRYRASARPQGSIHGQRWLGLLEMIPNPPPLFDSESEVAAVTFGPGEEPDVVLDRFVRDLCSKGYDAVGLMQRRTANSVPRRSLLRILPFCPTALQVPGAKSGPLSRRATLALAPPFVQKVCGEAYTESPISSHSVASVRGRPPEPGLLMS
jgi:hypothetical protein